ncbi:MAG: Eco57I restriction-modification methylase domain-containing protein [Tangfeifania sp.]
MKLISQTSAEKLRGGFYTPEPIADFILRWGINGSNNLDILEPSCGDGVFLEQLRKQNFSYNSVTAIELDEIEAIKAKSIPLENKEIINGDFHFFCNRTFQRFDLIIGNPPYIRYQFLIRRSKLMRQIFFLKPG